MPKTVYNYSTAILVGFIEGIIISLTLYCFLTGLGKAASIVINYTGYITLGAAFLLAMGGYFTRKEELSHTYDKRILKVYQGLDVADNIKKELIKDAVQEKEEWENSWDQKISMTESLPPFHYAVSIFIGYILGGILILINGTFFQLPQVAFFIIPVATLAVAGYIKYRMFGRTPIGGLFLTAGAGLAAALGAYWVSALI